MPATNPSGSPTPGGATTSSTPDQGLPSVHTQPYSHPSLSIEPVFGEEAPRTPTADAAASSPASTSSPKEIMAKLLKGKQKEWEALTEKEAPLRLLDLPVDVLREIIQHLPHTNDLTSLALTHSAFHALTIPCIYSRFDIVWPDTDPHAEPRTGVDALTYGLATLVMAEEIFGESPAQRAHAKSQTYRNGASRAQAQNNKAENLYSLPKRRRGNYYAQFTKKFSLGNGPRDWVQEYLITKEGGKMLGTLVALAVARMRNLETFVWDMPTGVLRDVWLALSSLADRDDGQECRLERLWIRWHDNSLIEPPHPLPPPPMPANSLSPQNAAAASGGGIAQAPVVVPIHQVVIPSAIDRVEYPTFSVIPALKSLNVLDIDELPYLDEMSILIARSQKRLRELRVGIARHAQQRDWVTAWNGSGVYQVDYSTDRTSLCSIGERRLGGVLGVLVGRVFNMRNNGETPRFSTTTELREHGLLHANEKDGVHPSNADPAQTMEARDHESESEHMELPAPVASDYYAHTSGGLVSQDGISSVTDPTDNPTNPDNDREPLEQRSASFKPTRQAPVDSKIGPLLDGKLQLETLELERVPLSVSVMLKAFDWSILTTLTLLHCNNHEQLWKTLRKTYSPKVNHQASNSSSLAYDSPKKVLRRLPKPSTSDYLLNLKKIHVNAVSPALIAFLRDALRPDSLEVLFLQEGRPYLSPVTIEAIYRGPLKRHKRSLKKLMIDSSERGIDGHITSSTKWKKWMLTREIVAFITSGQMPALRELAVTLAYGDWHYFLRRLPEIPHVRSLYIPHIADHPHGNNIQPHELAMQVVDIVHLRPEIEMCYMGLLTKCFEILESKTPMWGSRSDSTSSGADGGPPSEAFGVAYQNHHETVLSDDEDDETEDDDEDDPDGAITATEDESDSDLTSDAHDDSEDDDSFMQEDERKGPNVRLREILFYDDKIAIFKARHGRL